MTEQILTMLGTAIVIMSTSLVGTVVLWKHAGEWVKKHSNLLVSFSAGVFLVVAIMLAHESLHMFAGSYQYAYFTISFLLGIILIGSLFHFLPHFHHHHSSGESSHTHSNRVRAWRILLSDAIHNLADGFLLAAGFIVSIQFGIATAVGIFIHELIQEMSEFFVLKEAGYSTSRALFLNFATSSTILVGALVGFILAGQFTWLDGPILALAGGAFAVVVFYDLIPHSVRNSRAEQKVLPYVVAFTLGAVVMAVSALAITHMH